MPLFQPELQDFFLYFTQNHFFSRFFFNQLRYFLISGALSSAEYVYYNYFFVLSPAVYVIHRQYVRQETSLTMTDMVHPVCLQSFSGFQASFPEVEEKLF